MITPANTFSFAVSFFWENAAYILERSDNLNTHIFHELRLKISREVKAIHILKADMREMYTCFVFGSKEQFGPHVVASRTRRITGSVKGLTNSWKMLNF